MFLADYQPFTLTTLSLAKSLPVLKTATQQIVFFFCRSHTFAIRARPANLVGKTVHNLNVRGKRGNIVQVYPGVEYDFVPNRLGLKNGDYVHFQ